MSEKNPLSEEAPWSMVAGGYLTDTVPFFRQYCQKAFELSGYQGGERILDVACGPGTATLMLAEHAQEISAIDFSPGMLECLRSELERLKINNVKEYLMDGQQLEFGENEFDRAYSFFGLIFFPDRIQGFRELNRVVKSGGVVTVTGWAPIEDSELMTLLFGALQKAMPPDNNKAQPKLLNLEDPDQFRAEMEAGGFSDVQISPFNGGLEICDAEEFLDSMVRGSAPLVMLKNSLTTEEWRSKREQMLDYIRTELPELPVTLYSKAWIATGKSR